MNYSTYTIARELRRSTTRLKKVETTAYVSRILIVDDDPSNLIAVKAILNNDNYFVEIADSGMDAIKKTNESYFDLILCAVQMPGMDGFELATIFRATPSTAHTPIVLIAGVSENKEYEKRGLMVGAMDFLAKPIDVDILRLKVQNHLRNSRNYKALKASKMALNMLSNKLKSQSLSLQNGINYAQNIQTKMLASSTKINELDFHNFCTYLPKDTIGSDFYRIEEVGNRFVMICADCTGNGVPGALLSMFGIQTISNLIFESRILDPGRILTQLDAKIKQFFNDKHNHHGIDISIATFQPQIGILEYATAKRPLYLCSEDGVETLLGDKHAIGEEFEDGFKFSTLVKKIDRDQWLYQMTDGLSDQFGGLDDKRFGRKRMIQLLSDSTKLDDPLKIKTKFENIINLLSGDREQTDDITVIGSKLRPNIS